MEPIEMPEAELDSTPDYTKIACLTVGALALTAGAFFLKDKVRNKFFRKEEITETP